MLEKPIDDKRIDAPLQAINALGHNADDRNVVDPKTLGAEGTAHAKEAARQNPTTQSNSRVTPSSSFSRSSDFYQESDSIVAAELLELVAIIRRLRIECPWDRVQTHDSLRPMLIEEAYEAVEAIDSKDYTELKKELGDLLLHILFHSEIGAESGEFALSEVIRGESEKLIYRHPHVFSDTKVTGAAEVATNWERLKRRENGRNSVLDGVPASLPALQRATRIQEKASKVGFDWTEAKSVWKKVREEIEEFEAENKPDRRRDEFGDLLFSLVNIARHENLDAEGALREATQKFERRFREVEKRVEATGRDMKSFTLDELDAIWDEVKKEETAKRP